MLFQNLLLQNDLRSLIDEKEEIIIERDSLKSKVRRLNYELFIALQGNKSTPKVFIKLLYEKYSLYKLKKHFRY